MIPLGQKVPAGYRHWILITQMQCLSQGWSNKVCPLYREVVGKNSIPAGTREPWIIRTSLVRIHFQDWCCTGPPTSGCSRACPDAETHREGSSGVSGIPVWHIVAGAAFTTISAQGDKTRSFSISHSRAWGFCSSIPLCPMGGSPGASQGNRKTVL